MPSEVPLLTDAEIEAASDKAFSDYMHDLNDDQAIAFGRAIEQAEAKRLRPVLEKILSRLQSNEAISGDDICAIEAALQPGASSHDE